jgi:hypothetical protein
MNGKIIVSAFVLSLLTWGLFYYTGNPLNPASTSIVTGFYIIAGFIVRSLWILIRGAGKKNG